MTIVSRRTRSIRVFLAIAMAVSAFCIALALPSRAGATSFLWGVSGHPLVSYPGVPAQAQIDLVADLGLGSYRVDVTNLDQIGRLAELVAKAKARDVQILPILLPPVDLKSMSQDELYKTSYGFAQAFVTRFSGDIRAWELGNELENFAIIQPCEIRDDGSRYPCSWGPAGGVGPDEYVGARIRKVTAVLRGLSDAVHAVDPKARRAVGTAGWGHTGAFDRYRDEGVNWEISVWHHYGGNPEWAFKLLAKFGKPIWVTELNHPLGSNNGGEEGQAKGLEDAMAMLLKLAPVYNVEAAFVYELLDEAYWAPNFEAYMGLVQLQRDADGDWTLGNRKIAYQTVRRVIALGNQ